MSVCYLFKFTDEDAAIADPVIGQYHYPAVIKRGKLQSAYWAGIYPNEVVTDNATPPVPYAGFFLFYANGDDSQFDAHPALQVSWDPTIYGAGSIIVNNTGINLGADYNVSPIISGETGPFANSDSNG